MVDEPAHQLVARDTGPGPTRTEDLVILRFVSRPRPGAAEQRLHQLLAGALGTARGSSPDDLVVSDVEAVRPIGRPAGASPSS